MGRLVRPVILAGGAGSRLWPDSTPARPKHLLELFGSGTLLRQTIDRVGDSTRFLEPILVCSESQEKLNGSEAPDCRLVLETHPRGSAAAIALAAHLSDPAEILLVLPSDHLINDPKPLFDAVANALPAAEAGRLVTFGIKPTHAETGFGYITVGRTIEASVREVREFVEKPQKARAEELLRSGEAFWNSGMFQFTAGAFLDELRQYAPAIHDATRASIAGASSSGSRVRPDPDALERSPSDSIDYAVMEHSHRIAVVPLDMQWSDVGSWAAVHKLSSKDEDGNVAENGHAIDSRNCLIRSSGPTVVAIGVEDLVIVATPDHVLVVPRSEAQRVREAAALAEKLAKKG